MLAYVPERPVLLRQSVSLGIVLLEKLKGRKNVMLQNWVEYRLKHFCPVRYPPRTDQRWFSL